MDRLRADNTQNNPPSVPRKSARSPCAPTMCGLRGVHSRWSAMVSGFAAGGDSVRCARDRGRCSALAAHMRHQ
eukprot:7380330-Prymnesium_polylepis.3